MRLFVTILETQTMEFFLFYLHRYFQSKRDSTSRILSNIKWLDLKWNTPYQNIQPSGQLMTIYEIALQNETEGIS